MQSIEEYVDTLRTKTDKAAGKDEKRKTKKALELMSAILKERGHEIPDEADKAEFSRRSKSNERETNSNLQRAMRYYLALQEEQSGQQLMIPVALPESERVPEPSRAGRKVLDTERGEKRSEKLMLYLTPSMIADIRDWCDLKHISSVNYITELIRADMKTKQEKLKSFREFRNRE